MLRLCARKIYFVYNRHYFKVVIERKINIRKRLRLYALRRVNNEHRSFTCRKASRNFVCEIDVARSVDKVEHVAFTIAVVVKHSHCRRLYRYTALPFDIHRVEKLIFHIAHGYSVGKLHHSVGKRRFAVVNMSYYAKVPYKLAAECHLSFLLYSSVILCGEYICGAERQRLYLALILTFDHYPYERFGAGFSDKHSSVIAER